MRKAMPTTSAPDLPKLALITPWGALCGIAAYSHHLKAALDAHFDVTVFPLEEYVLQNNYPRLISAGDTLIRDFSERLSGFDYVNIQLEYGTLGASPVHVYRRLMRLCRAAPNLTITLHTILPHVQFSIFPILKHVLRFRFGRALTELSTARKERLLSQRVFSQLHKMQRRKPVKAIVHTRREWRRLSLQEGLANVYHHPLAFLDLPQITAIRAASGRHSFPVLKALPADAVIIGVFGFISPYKNFEFVIEALRSLPPNHHLAIFGAVNPKSLVEREGRAHDLEALFAAGRFDETLDDDLVTAWLDREAQRSAAQSAGLASALAPGGGASAQGEPVSWMKEVEALRDRSVVTHPRNLKDRVHFLGAMDDADYFRGMNACDLVVFPYLEVGQTSSGPISQAVELGCRVLAARNRAFLEFAKYHPGRLELYDIGNIVEFVEKTKIALDRPRPVTAPRYTCETSTANYVEALTNTNTKVRSVIEVIEAQDAVWGSGASLSDEPIELPVAANRPGLRALGPVA